MERVIKKSRQKNTGVDFDFNLYGKIPPQAVEVEKSLLGACLIDADAFDSACELIKSEMFYKEEHKKIWNAMMEVNKITRIDIVTLIEQLLKNEVLEEVGGAYYITQLTNDVVRSGNIIHWARILVEKHLKREIIRLSGALLTDSYSDSSDVFDLIESADQRISELVFRNVKSMYQHVHDVSVKSILRIEELRHSETDITGITSGFHTIDTITHGWQSTDLIILAARPSVGKTAFALNLARNAARNSENPCPVAFFSLEMSSRQLVDRLLSAESEIPLEKFATGKMEEHEMARLSVNVLGRMKLMPIFIDDTASLSIIELRSKARNLKKKENIGMIIIDYLQLMSGEAKSGNREQEISKISRELKSLAKELQVPVIALSQLSRETEKRKGEAKIPQLSDLRESGAIEQDADMVMFLYRPEYYDVNSDEMGDSIKGETHVKIAKHRNGILSTIKLKAELHIQRFIEMEQNFYGNSSFQFPARRSGFTPISSILSNDKGDDLPF